MQLFRQIYFNFQSFLYIHGQRSSDNAMIFNSLIQLQIKTHRPKAQKKLVPHRERALI